MVFRLLSLHVELQDMILDAMDEPCLAGMSRVNRDMCSRVTPQLWRATDFGSWDRLMDIDEKQRVFFVAYDLLRQERPERSCSLASLVQSLKVAQFPSFSIFSEERDETY